MSSSVLEMPLMNDRPAIAVNVEREVVRQEIPDVGLSEDELQSLHRDDAMASAVIAIILGCAFLVLLGLTIGVGIWTVTAAG